MTLETAAGHFDMSSAQLSRIETAKSPYTQDFLELAALVYNTDVFSLLFRNPKDEVAIWPLWEQAKPRQRRLIISIARTITDE